MKYVNLVIDNKNDNTDMFYTYGCEFENVAIGDKVYVPFNRGNKIKEAYIFEVKDNIDKEIKNLKFVDSIDQEVSLTEESIETCKWMKKRYLCRYIDAVKLFLPAGEKAKRRVQKEPLKEFKGEEQNIESLTQEQSEAMEKIREALHRDKQDLFLLHGVTGSGKTEIYMQATAENLESGKNTIVLVPEVSLTNQVVDRFIHRFGSSNIALIHGKLSKGERYDQWQKVKNGQCRIVIGTRMAVFAPLDNIGLIVLDEEHETSYKSDQNPKYDTVEIAIKRTKAFNGTVIMGSATPSVISLKRCEDNIYEKIQLKDRYNSVKLPEVEVVDMRNELKDGNKTVFSKKLFDEIRRAVDEKRQVILLINKRGYSSSVSCRACGFVAKCSKCQIAMTYYKKNGKLKCNYCGYQEDMPEVCPTCGSQYIKQFGAGTEKVLEEVKKYFPEATSEKLDFDEAKKKGQIKQTLDDFARGKIDILVGTQMVGKGLDVKNVSLVGIMAIDTTLNIPDYRASERAFQLITQAAGRAGRGNTRGKVIVQTYNPDNFVIKTGALQDIDTFSNRELRIREIMDYPPFGVFTQIVVSGNDRRDVEDVTSTWLKACTKNYGKDCVVGIRKAKRDNKIIEYRYIVLIKYKETEKKKFMALATALKEELRKGKVKSSSIIDINPSNVWRS